MGANMSDIPSPTPEAPKPAPPAQAPEPEAKAEPDWKAEARKWEEFAKKNKAAADRLAEIEEASKSETEKAKEQAANVARERDEALSRLNRYEVALAKGLTPSQAKRLVGTTREELEADADELLKDIGDSSKPRPPKPDPNQGRDTSGTASTGEQFAAAVNGLFSH